MSRHHKEREEKICLNCNAATYGRFCHVCGQENIETTESFWELLKHFVFDLFHFDGKFWVTLKYLLLKPGFLAKEYIRGRRASYLHPIRMYIFINTIFFIIFFSFYNNVEKVDSFKFKPTSTSTEKINKLELAKKRIAKKMTDSVFALRKTEFANYLKLIDADIAALKKDSSLALLPMASDNLDTSGFYINNKRMMSYKSMEQYDSFQTTLPKKDRDGYFKQYLNKISFEYKEAEKQGKGKEYRNQWLDKLLHSVPKILFVSMPFFALILMILYVRNKKYFYVHHIIFTLYFYCGIFILNLFSLWGNSLIEMFTQKTESSFLSTIFSIATLLYIYKSFRNFYEQNRLKTILKLFSILIFIAILFGLIALLAVLLISINF